MRTAILIWTVLSLLPFAGCDNSGSTGGSAASASPRAWKKVSVGDGFGWTNDVFFITTSTAHEIGDEGDAFILYSVRDKQEDKIGRVLTSWQSLDAAKQYADKKTAP